MKTAQANLGLGDASTKRRNRRVKQIGKLSWAEARRHQFQHNIRFAAAAKSYRTLCEVTQREVAAAYGVSIGSVCNWESGKYNWQGSLKELNEYQATIRRISQ